MSFKLTIHCDEPGCTAMTVVSADFNPSISDNVPSGAMAVWDTEWVSMPTGWYFTEDDGDRCPAHAGRLTT